MKVKELGAELMNAEVPTLEQIEAAARQFAEGVWILTAIFLGCAGLWYLGGRWKERSKTWTRQS